MTEREKITIEKMAEHLFNKQVGATQGQRDISWRNCSAAVTSRWRGQAEETLNLTDSNGKRYLGVIAEDQSLPTIPFSRGLAYDGAFAAQKKMGEVGFVKIEKGK